ncbi:MAG: LptF/LptG family permease [Candidatus Zixiibacteriota bacterium]
MRILARYIVREHIAPFLFAFFTITFLLIIDYVPKIIDHVIDKNLSIWVVLELIGVNLAWMLALSVPMAVLVATLMAFGRLSADFEITAIKACGVNLLHILIPLLAVASVLAFGMVQFNDKVLPDLNKRARMLWGDISAMRPTLIFRSGIFVTDVPGYLILIDRINHVTSRVDGVRITETKNPTKPRIIVAEYGFLKMTDNGKNMEFTLYNGEVHSLDTQEPDNYRKVNFLNQVINIAGSPSELVRTDSDYRTDREMSISDMRTRVIEAQALVEPFRERIAASLHDKLKYLLAEPFEFRPHVLLSDSAATFGVRTDAMALAKTVERSSQQMDAHEKTVDKFQIEIYKKYSIPAACLVFIVIGAPLGILSRKGGMGVAISISIALFIIYWAFLIGGEDLADRGMVSPFWAMWGANILLGALGLYLMYIVVSERPIFAFFRRLS